MSNSANVVQGRCSDIGGTYLVKADEDVQDYDSSDDASFDVVGYSVRQRHGQQEDL